MYKYYNANPSGPSVGDCVKRALAAMGMDYADVQRELNRYKKITGAKSFNSDHDPHRYVEEVLGGKKISFEKKMTVGEFCEKYPRGRYILDMDGHWSACVDGCIYDTWDCSKEKVNFAYEIQGEGYKTPDLKKQVFKYCCTWERISDTETIIRIYDGNGTFAERKIPTELTAGYVRCLQDSNYKYIEL